MDEVRGKGMDVRKAHVLPAGRRLASGRSFSLPLVSLAILLSAGVSACAGSRAQTKAGTIAPGATVERVEMEPLEIAVVGTGAERHVEAYDAATLFEQAGADLQTERFATAAAGYDRVVAKFPESRYAVPSLYNAGLALEGKKDYEGAVARYRTLVEKHGETRDALDGLFRMASCLAELKNWAASADAFNQVLQHKDIGTEDRIEAMARRALAQYNMKDGAAAERTLRETLSFYREKEALERVDNNFFVAMAQFYLAEIAHDSFKLLPIRLPERQMRKDLEAKAQQLLVTQGRYVDVARLRNAAWATAAGYQMASLYKEFYDSVMEAPVPVMTDEMKKVYFEELKKEIEPLLRKAIHAHELTQQVAERNGVDNEWVKKSNDQLEQLRALVAPNSPPPPELGLPPLRTIPTRPESDKMQQPSIPPHGDESRNHTVL